MADGSYLNNVECRRIHRSNAQDVVDEADSMLQYYRDRVLVLAAMTPMPVDDGGGPVPWDFYVRSEIDGMWEEIQDNVLQRFKAQYILDWPEDVVDDYDPLKDVGAQC